MIDAPEVKRPRSRADQWQKRLHGLRKKMLRGEVLSTEEIEAVLLWKAIGFVKGTDEAKATRGLDMLSSIYDTRSRAKMAPGNVPPKPKPDEASGAAAKKYGVEAPVRPETTPTAVADETPRGWIPDLGS